MINAWDGQSYKEQANNLAGCVLRSSFPTTHSRGAHTQNHRQIAFLKSYSTASAQTTAREAVQIFGGRGITQTGMGRFIEHYHRTIPFDALLGGGVYSHFNPGCSDSNLKFSGGRVGGPWGSSGDEVHAKGYAIVVVLGGHMEGCSILFASLLCCPCPRHRSHLSDQVIIAIDGILSGFYTDRRYPCRRRPQLQRQNQGKVILLSSHPSWPKRCLSPQRQARRQFRLVKELAIPTSQ
jgi:hypothetical protein